MSKKQRPKYGMKSNVTFMLDLAWQNYNSVIFLAISQAVLGVAISLTELFSVPEILKRLQEHKSLQELLSIILTFALCLIFFSALNEYIGTNTLFGRVAVRGLITIKIHDKFMQTSYPNIEKQEFLKLKEKVLKTISSNDQSTEAIWNTLVELLKNGIGFVIFLLLLTSVDPILIGVVLLTTITGNIISNRIYEWGYRHREEEAEITHRISYIADKARDLSLAKDIRIFGMKDWLEELHTKAIKLYDDFCARQEKVYLSADILDILLTLLRNGIAYLYLITMALDGRLTAPQFLLYFTAVSGFTAWITGLLSGVTTLYKQSLDLSAVREFMEYAEPFTMEEGRAIQPVKGKGYCIELKHVSFRYPGAERDTLKDINLKILPGEKLAVVGLNGAGKTTLIKLICGFFDPTEGEVLLNGVNISEYNRRDYYKHFSAVFQDFSLLASTVAENVTQNDCDIDMGKVRTCIEKAGLRQKVESLPLGYQTLLVKKVFDDAVDLSGGEIQRLMLARALYKEGPIIVLDEPTAALDSIAESDIYNRYNDLTFGCTSIFISHRLASTRFCNRILLIDGGVIAEEGSHEELMRLRRKYTELFEIQSRYYREGRDENGEFRGLSLE